MHDILHQFLASNCSCPSANFFSLNIKVTSATELIGILHEYMNDEENPLRMSIPTLDALPEDIVDISSHLKFVDREQQIGLLMKHMNILYNLVQNPRAYNEPRRQIVITTAVGTSGKGKTTFARRAVENRKHSDLLEFEATVDECVNAGRNYRIACDSLERSDFLVDPKVSFGRKLLYEALKYRLRDR